MTDRRVGGSKHNGRSFDVYNNNEGIPSEGYYANGEKMPQEVFNKWVKQYNERG